MSVDEGARSIPDRVQDVFREVFDDPTLQVTATTTASEIEDWDSLNHIVLILALEEEFGVEFKTEEITSMADVGDLFQVLSDRL